MLAKAAVPPTTERNRVIPEVLIVRVCAPSTVELKVMLPLLELDRVAF